MQLLCGFKLYIKETTADNKNIYFSKSNKECFVLNLILLRRKVVTIITGMAGGRGRQRRESR